jgi:hypothetical protein
MDNAVAVGAQTLKVLQFSSMRLRHVLDLDQAVVDLNTSQSVLTPK